MVCQQNLTRNSNKYCARKSGQRWTRRVKQLDRNKNKEPKMARRVRLMDKKKTKDKKGQGGQYRWTDTETEDRNVQGGFDR